MYQKAIKGWWLQCLARFSIEMANSLSRSKFGERAVSNDDDDDIGFRYRVFSDEVREEKQFDRTTHQVLRTKKAQKLNLEPRALEQRPK